MTTYDISGNMVTISNDMENERYLLSTTDEYIESVNETFGEWYAAQGSCYGIVEETDNLYNGSIVPLINIGIDILNAQGVYSLDEDSFYDKYVKKFHLAEHVFEVVRSMQKAVEAVNIRQEEEEMYRQVRKESRGRVVGGGFGLGGAIKGMAQAGMMNAASGIAHSAFNAVGNVGSGIAASSDKAAIYKKYKEPLKTALMQDLYDIRNAIRTALQKEAGIVCKYVTDSEYDKAKAIWNNYRLGRIPAEKKKEQIIEALTLNPYSIEIYDSIWEDYGDENGELRKMATYFGIPLEQQIAEIAEQYGNDLFTKSCSLYEESFDKKTAAVQIENQIKATLDELVQYCKRQTISEDNISKIAQCKQLLEEIDIEVRTVKGVTYDTRELAENVRKDFATFYRALQGKDIFEKETYEYLKSADYITEEFKGIFESVFGTEYGLRTPEKIYENIDFIIRQSLTDEIIKGGWIDIPDHIGSFSSKETMISSVTGILAEELILALFDRSSKGKSGILLTNRFLRIYAKGLLLGENLAYPIEQVEKIECQENDTYVISIQEQGPVTFSMKRTDLTVDEQLAFSDMLNELIRIVKNLSTENRLQLFRIYKHTKICRCGMLLLADEKICPSCKCMIKDNGEFVETQICPKCNNYVQIGKKFCSICGYQLDGNEDSSNISEVEEVKSDANEKDVSENLGETVKELVCPKCHSIVKADKKFCSKCGTKIQ